MVLLKRQKEGKTSHYHIDQNVNRKIHEHIQLFKKIYSYHNRPKPNYDTFFEENLTNNYKLLHDTISVHDPSIRKYLVQCISDNMCFHKGLLSSKLADYSKNIEN